MSDTPRTDEAEISFSRLLEDRNPPSYLVPAEFAQRLERALVALWDIAKDVPSIKQRGALAVLVRAALYQ